MGTPDRRQPVWLTVWLHIGIEGGGDSTSCRQGSALCLAIQSSDQSSDESKSHLGFVCVCVCESKREKNKIQTRKHTCWITEQKEVKEK